MKGISGGEVGPANVVKPGSSVAAKGGLTGLSRPNHVIPNGKNADTGKRKKSPLLDNRPELLPSIAPNLLKTPSPFFQIIWNADCPIDDRSGVLRARRHYQETLGRIMQARLALVSEALL
jgi:hypothetical protein